MRFPIDTTKFDTSAFVALGVQAEMEFDREAKATTGVQRRNADGLLRWQVIVQYVSTNEVTGRLDRDEFTIKVDSATEPVVEMYRPVATEGLRFDSYTMNGKTGFTLRADAVETI